MISINRFGWCFRLRSILLGHHRGLLPFCSYSPSIVCCFCHFRYAYYHSNGESFSAIEVLESLCIKRFRYEFCFFAEDDDTLHAPRWSAEHIFIFLLVTHSIEVKLAKSLAWMLNLILKIIIKIIKPNSTTFSREKWHDFLDHTFTQDTVQRCTVQFTEITIQKVQVYHLKIASHLHTLNWVRFYIWNQMCWTACTFCLRWLTWFGTQPNNKRQWS